MLGINLAAVVLCGVGFFVGWRIIRRGRLPFESEDALLSWNEYPASVFHYDKLCGLLITVHALATMTLCVLLVCAVNRVSVSPIAWAFSSPASEWLARITGFHDRQVHQMSTVAAFLGAGIGAFNFGVLLSFPISRRFGRPVLVHLHPEGIIYGQNSALWREIGSYQVDPDRQLIKLFTHSSSRSPQFVLHPPSGALFIEAESKVRELLPDTRIRSGSSKLLKRWLSGGLFLLAILFVLLGAFWIYQYVAEWVWFLYAVGVVGLLAGGRVLVRI